MKDKLSYVCTIGPSMQEISMLEEMYSLGMSTIRFNMSYNHSKIYELIKMAKDFKKTHPDIELLFDSAGPEIRVKIDKKMEFHIEDTIIIGKDFNVTSDNLNLLEIGDLVYLKDGDYILEVLENNGRETICKAKTDGFIENNYKLYNDKLYSNLPFLSNYDEETIKLAVENNIDSFAVSFVRSADNIKQIKDTFMKYGKNDIKIIAKIETKMSLENIDEIIDMSDELMIARGDLSTLLPRVNIGFYQKYISQKCKMKNKPLMVATGVLASMEKKEDPTISEILDLYNIILDGIRKVVFTGETSIAVDPLDVLNTANEIFEATKILY